MDAQELAALERLVHLTKIEIAALHQPNAGEDRIKAATQELSAIVTATEDATQRVLGAAESIGEAVERVRAAMPDPRVQEPLGAIMDAVVRIFEAANFQDITGQRINTVVRTLNFVEARVAAMVTAWGPAAFENLPRPEEVSLDDERNLLNGPQLDGKAISQADIDALFD